MLGFGQMFPNNRPSKLQKKLDFITFHVNVYTKIIAFALVAEHMIKTVDDTVDDKENRIYWTLDISFIDYLS